jgi:hypothetical protein
MKTKLTLQINDLAQIKSRRSHWTRKKDAEMGTEFVVLPLLLKSQEQTESVKSIRLLLERQKHKAVRWVMGVTGAV